MAASTRALTPSHSGAFDTAAVATDTSPNTSSQSQSLAPIAAAASAAAQRLSGSPRAHKLSPRFSPQPLTGIAALVDEKRAREDRALEEGRRTSPNPSAAAIASLQAFPTSPARMTDAQAAQATAGRALQIPPTTQAGNDNETAMQTSPVSMTSNGSNLDVSNNPATTAPTLATAPAHDNSIPMPDQPNDRAAVDPGITGVHDSGGSRAFTFPPPPADDPRLGTPTRNMSLPNPGYSGGSPRTGSGQRRHKCPYCATDFTRHHNLKSHLLTHSQEKPYECETCQARFRRLHDLKRHQKLHTGERPHTCQKCGRKFARGDALARHNKGNGGCAGRRSSFGGLDGDSGEAMDGIQYTAEPETMEDPDLDEERRRISEPGAHRNNSMQSNRNSSTYPPLGPGYRANTNVAPMYPPTTTSSLSGSVSSAINPYPTAGQHAAFPSSGMTESPKPISPGLAGTSRPPQPQQQQQQHHLPPIGSGQQLPPLRGGTGTANGSGSSSHGSGASMRDFLGRTEADVWNVARELEGKLARAQDEHAALQERFVQMEREYQAKVGSLLEEIRGLKGAAPAAVPSAVAGGVGDAKPRV